MATLLLFCSQAVVRTPARNLCTGFQVLRVGKRTGLTLTRRANTCRWAVSREECLAFGKHKGKSFDEVFMIDRSYCEWILDLQEPGLPSHRFAEWIRERHPDFVAARAQNVMTFGKYNGKSYDEVFTIDMSYCGLLLKRASQRDSGLEMRQFAVWIYKRHPDFAANVQEWMAIGKHQGKSYEDIFANDACNCEWSLDFSQPGWPSHHFAEWIRERHPDFESMAQDVMTFGKCQWILGASKEEEASAGQRHFETWIRQRDPDTEAKLGR